MSHEVNHPEELEEFQTPISTGLKDDFPSSHLMDEYLEKLYPSQGEISKHYDTTEVKSLKVEQRLGAVFKIPKPINMYMLESPISLVWKFRGTALQLCVCRPDFWLLLAFHAIISVIYYGVYQHENLVTVDVKGIATAKGWPEASYTLVGIPGILITFATVFYVTQTYKRWFEQYSNVKGAGSKLGEVIFMIRTHFRDGEHPQAAEVRSHLTNLMNAAHILAYAGLPQNRYSGLYVWAFDYCKTKQLLTAGQAERLETLLRLSDGRMAFREVLLWVSSGVWKQVHAERLDPRVAFYIHRRIFEFRDHLDLAYFYTAGPVPFAYYHHLNLITLVYLLLLGYTVAFAGPWMSIPCYALVLFGFISAREIANIMSDPFGGDDTDLPVFELAMGGVNCFTKLAALPPNDELAPPYPPPIN